MSRWDCSFGGCEKSFARKEHLTRHERTHAIGNNLYTCKVCLQKFNRSDSLQRHLTRHGDEYRPDPSGRIKKACIACHTGKIKCDGAQPCYKCRAKGATCRYEQVEQHDQISLSNSSPGVVEVTSKSRAQPSPQSIQSSSTFHAEELDLSSLNAGLQPHPVVSGSQPATVSSTNAAARENSFLDWKEIQICKDPPPDIEHLHDTPHGNAHEGSPPMTSDDATDRYTDLYFTHFHHRWPVVHRPAYNSTNQGLVLRSSLFMIGGWLSGTPEGREYALRMHEYLVMNVMNVLDKKTSTDVFQQDTLPSAFCQAVLINIVFALMVGKSQLVSRAVILQGTLVSVLREVGFFRSATIWADEKPGTFKPFQLSLQEERKRLAQYLFRTDNYLSLIRNQPGLLISDELHFTLPATYSLWNADGLHVLAKRMENEPVSRDTTAMSDRIKDVYQGTTVEPKDEPMLVEDILLYMCSNQSKVAGFWIKIRSCSFNFGMKSYKAECPRPRLDALKHRLNLISCRLSISNTVDLGANDPLPLKHYYGYEEPTEPGWQDAAVYRVKSLVIDAVMLYHLLHIQLNADIRMFTQIAKDRSETVPFPLPEKRQREREQRVDSAKTWAGTSLARRTLCHSTEILVLHQNNTEWEIQTLDPIAYVALATAALVVWAYCIFSETLDPTVTVFAELTKWCGANEKERGAFIGMGAGMPVQIDGVRLYACNAVLLAEKFRSLLPEGWEVAESIGPGILVQAE